MNFMIKTAEHPLIEELTKIFMGMPIVKIENMEGHRYKIEAIGKFCTISIVLEHGETEEIQKQDKNEYVTSTPPVLPIKKGEWRVPFPNSQTYIQLASLYQLGDVKNLICNLELGHEVKKEKP